MIVRLLIIVIIACFVFWVIKRVLPALRSGQGRKYIPLVMNPVTINILRRVFTILLRLVFRR